jgi:phosphatidylglycerol:prolipoprotein diacylglycerol transferase
MLYLGLVAGVFAGDAAAHAIGVDPFRVFVATCVLIVPGLIGARILYVAANWRFYRRNLREIWNRKGGGAAQYGGLALALPLSVPLLLWLRLPFAEFWDVASFTILVGMIFTRIGCLLNGCCAGRPSTSWLSLNLRNRTGIRERRIPVQLLEAGLAFLILLVLILLLRFHLFPGALFLIGLIGYGAGRFVLEFGRELRPQMNSPYISRSISLAIILCSLALLATHVREAVPWQTVSPAISTLWRSSRLAR